MKYCGIDLHSNNSVVSVVDEADHVVAEKRFPDDDDRFSVAMPLACQRFNFHPLPVKSTFLRSAFVFGCLLATGGKPATSC